MNCSARSIVTSPRSPSRYSDLADRDSGRPQRIAFPAGLNGSETAQIGWPQVSGYVPLTNPVGSMQMAGDIVMPPASRSEPNDGGDLAGRKTATMTMPPGD